MHENYRNYRSCRGPPLPLCPISGPKGDSDVAGLAGHGDGPFGQGRQVQHSDAVDRLGGTQARRRRLAVAFDSLTSFGTGADEVGILIITRPVSEARKWTSPNSRKCYPVCARQTRASHRLGSAGVAALFDRRLWPTAGEVTGDLIAGAIIVVRRRMTASVRTAGRAQLAVVGLFGPRRVRPRTVAALPYQPG